MSERTGENGARFPVKLWVPIVLVIGLVVGEVLSLVSIGSRPPGPQPGVFGHSPSPFPRDPLFGLHIVLTTVQIALILSLLVIYVRMYVETRASFSLGLVVMLGAFFVEAFISYPLISEFLGPVAFGPGFSSSFDDVVAICAYIVFLYLSLG